ncbi:MAG TPA: aminotransferase [Deltaproteobacteria bacterium]|nr:aminotransferase [Deltaproteobacteria bacterium]HCP46235.1 aminotransferase [Deltaproteobacteria bacterium]
MLGLILTGSGADQLALQWHSAPMTVGDGWAWLDGAVQPLSQARVPVTDRGFLLADSVFDTVRTYAGQPFLLGDHLDRLRSSAETLWIDVPWSDQELETVVDALLQRAGDSTAWLLRLVVSRGDGGHGLALPEPQAPRLVVLCRPVPDLPGHLYSAGVGVGRARRKTVEGRSVPAHIKSGAYLAHVLALREAQAAGAYEALLPGPDQSWSEATTSNLFLVAGGALHTPGVQHDILPGVTRALVIAVAGEAGIPVVERPLFDSDLNAAHEVFLTSSVKEVLPVVSIDSVPVGAGVPGPITQQLRRLFREATEQLTQSGTRRLVERYGG